MRVTDRERSIQFGKLLKKQRGPLDIALAEIAKADRLCDGP